MGKTALLEALWIHTGPNLPDLGNRLAGFRGIPGQDPGRLMHDLFYDFDPTQAITLSAKGIGGVSKGILDLSLQKRDDVLVNTVSSLGTPSDPPRGSQEPDVSAVSDSAIVLDYTDGAGRNYVSSGWWARAEGQAIQFGANATMTLLNEGMAAKVANMPSRPSNVILTARQRSTLEEDVARFGKVELDGYAGQLTACLRHVDDRIKRLLTISSPPAAMIYVDVGLNRPIPIGFLGDGLSRFLSIALAFHEARGGMIFIDEVENGLHHSVLRSVWEDLRWLSREFDVQVFATTHSNECLVAARDAFASMEDEDFSIHRLGLQEGGVSATTYSFAELDFTLDYGAEMR